MTGQTQYGGQNYSGTSASMNWGIRDIPTPKEMVQKLDEWVIGQPAAKKVGWLCCCGAGQECHDPQPAAASLASLQHGFETSCPHVDPGRMLQHTALTLHCCLSVYRSCWLSLLLLLCAQVLAVAVHNHYKRLQNKRMHKAQEAQQQAQAAMVSSHRVCCM